MLVGLQVLGQLIDARGKQRDLHFRRPGIGVMRLVLLDHRGFPFTY